MSAIVTSSCTDSGPLSLFANKFFQDCGVASSTKKLVEQGRNTTNSFHFSNLERNGKENEELNSWNHFIQRKWSDEKFTEVYIKQRGLDRPHKDITSLQDMPIHPCENSFVQEFISITSCQDSSLLHFSPEEYSSFMTNDHAVTYNTLHNDILQAQIYLFDHLSSILRYPMITTCRPSPEAEWDWAKLFSSSRWCSNDKDDNDKISDGKYIQSVALERMQLFLGHIIDPDVEQKNRIT
ncbi:37385_t:CDS:2 [Gigaspora margarita]|uniref:37385_t:CDS:1 n=1 Tax=Gigaspora margarita TaxID=4874 RepID=A0ABN7UZL6_GIGMA|nr:37385_t:CDS:2 [Gigaspora margarita]